MDEPTNTAMETTTPTEDATPSTCACGCGAQVSPGKTWIRGHHHRGRPGEAPLQDLTLVALTPADMVPAQTALGTWCDQKIAAVQAELSDLEINLELAVSHGWKHASVAASLNRTHKRILYYEKMKAAVEAGYLLVPNFPIDVFAVRVKRTQQPSQTSKYEYSSGYKTARAELLPAGEGRYVDETLEIRDLSYTKKLENGQTERVGLYASGDYDTVDFPVVAVKPAILQATQRAMAMKVFDEMGTVQNQPGSGRDPIVIGRLRDPRGNNRCATFFVAWWLDTASL